MSEKKKPNWNKIRNDYESSNISHRKLSEKYNVSYNTLKDRAKRELWTKSKEEIHSKITAKTQQKTIEIISTQNAVEKAEDINRNTMHIKAWDLLYQRIIETLENKPKALNPLTGKIQEYDYSAKDMSELAKALDKLQAGHRKAENVIDTPTLKKLELDREKFEHDKQSNTDKVINVISNIPRPPATGGDEQ